MGGVSRRTTTVSQPETSSKITPATASEVPTPNDSDGSQTPSAVVATRPRRAPRTTATRGPRAKSVVRLDENEALTHANQTPPAPNARARCGGAPAAEPRRDDKWQHDREPAAGLLDHARAHGTDCGRARHDRDPTRPPLDRPRTMARRR